MKTTSWEIILAGFLFVGVAIYLIENSSGSTKPSQAPTPPDSVRMQIDGERLKVIELRNLDNLEDLKNLENLKNLRNLKNITNFLPAEIRAEVEAEIDEAMSEFSQESVDVVLNTEEGTISINRAMAVSSGNWSAVSPGLFVYVKEFDASELNEANLKLPFGSIEVVGSSSPEAKLTVQASGQISSKEDLRSKLNTIADITSEAVRFEINKRNSANRDHSIQLQATLHVPENANVYSTTDAGHISSENITGTQHYKTMGGHIVLKNLSGDLTAQTGGGHISVSNSDGDFQLNSKGGNITTENSSGTLFMETAGGNLQAYDFGGSFQASTNGGNIEFKLLELTENSTATTGAGSITIWFPKNGNADFDLSGSTVEIDKAFNFSGTQSSGTGNGTIGNGGYNVTAKTNYGKVTLKPNN